jgi:AraC-like DNA-binding protein
VKHHEGATFVAQLPHPALKGLVEHYYVAKIDSAVAVASHWVDLPDTTIRMVINSNDPLRLATAPRPRTCGEHGSFVTGMASGPRTWIPADTQCIIAEFSPLGCYQLLNVAMPDLTDAVVALDDVLGTRIARKITDRLTATANWQDGLILLDDFLVTCLSTAMQPSPQTQHVWRQLSRSAGTIPIQKLATEVGWTRQHLTNRLRQQTGMPPKALAKTMRMQRALSLLTGPQPLALSQVATMCGYHDQAHFHHDFKALCGSTPTEVRRAHVACHGDGSGALPGPDVNRLAASVRTPVGVAGVNGCGCVCARFGCGRPVSTSGPGDRSHRSG